jgi:hypothetical protein
MSAGGSAAPSETALTLNRRCRERLPALCIRPIATNGSAIIDDMFVRYVLVAVVVTACGKADPTPPQAAPAAKVAASPSAEPAGSNAPKDPPGITTVSDIGELEREVAPYSARARKSYPDAKRRYLAGLPPGYHFSVVTKLSSPGHSEVVFVVVTGIQGDQITGRIADEIRSVAGYKIGDSYTLPESAIIDWVIVAPDGREEGNLVGKFLDERDAKRQHQEPPPAH